MLVAEIAENCRQEKRGDGRDRPNAHVPALPVVGDLGQRVVDQGHDLLGPRKQQASSVSERHLARLPLEDWLADLFFQLRDGAAQSRLSDRQFFPSPSEVLPLGDLEEVAELIDFHRRGLASHAFSAWNIERLNI